MNGPRFAGMGAHHTPHAGTTDEWLTPPHVLAALGAFDLDPCAPEVRPWPMAEAHYTRRDNGLILPWFGRVWLNPPYGREIGQWLARLADHGRGTALIFARTETEAFFREVWERSTALLFLRGRLTFLGTDGKPRRLRSGQAANSGAPSVLCAYGLADADVLASAELPGQFVPLRLPRIVFALAILPTWADALSHHLRGRGPMPLADIYRALAGHPKTRGRAHWQAKVRQTLQQGPFERVDRGLWKLEERACQRS